MTNRYAVAFSISVLLFVISAFVDPPIRYVLWIAGLTIDIAAPPLTLKFQRNLPRLSTTKLLWEQYHPQYRVWIPFAIIGFLAAIALGIFGRLAKRWKDMNA